MPVKATDVKLLQDYIEKGWEFHIIDMLHDLKSNIVFVCHMKSFLFICINLSIFPRLRAPV